MDLFSKLGFGITNLPFGWPNNEYLGKVKTTTIDTDIMVEMPEGVNEKGIANNK